MSPEGSDDLRAVRPHGIQPEILVTQLNFPKPGLLHGLGLVSIVLPMTASAQSTYVGGTGNWSTAASWNPASVPASGANITLSGTSATGGTLTLDGGVSRVIGSYTHGNVGSRTTDFNIQTTATASMTIGGGITANGAFTGIGLRLRGSYDVSADQFWQVGGEIGSHAADRGVTFNEISAGNVSSLALNGALTKTGSGQLSFAAVSVSGPGDVQVNDGSLKLNAAASLPLTVSGSGKIAVNNSATLILSKNSGTFAITRPFEFNHTSKLETGSGRNDQTGIYDIASDMAWKGNHTITTQQNGSATPANVNYRFTGVMSGSGNITKAGPSVLLLGGTAANTHTGTLTLSAGELHLEKPAGTAAVLGNINVTGGLFRILNSNQVADTSTITVSGGNIGYNNGRLETIAALNISSGAGSSLSGLTVTGATTITAGIQDVNSGEKFTTKSLSISNASLRPVGNAAAGAFTTIEVGMDGLTLNSGRIILGNMGGANTIDLKLAGDVVTSATSMLSATNSSGPRVIDLLGTSRNFTITNGTLEIRAVTDNGTNLGPSVRNGTLVKSGAGTLVLSRSESTADFSFTEGPVQIKSESVAGNVTHSAGPLLMDIGGASPAKLTTTGNFTATGGIIEISAATPVTFTGTRDLLRYEGSLVGTPAINIPASLAASRVNPVLNYGTGTNSAITITSTAVPLSLAWSGSNGGVWNNNTTANFNGGSEKFYALDSVTFGDVAGSYPSILLDSPVFPTDVVFSHGVEVPVYTLSGAGSISGPTKLTKDGSGTTILATDNNYTGVTNILAGTLQVGNGGLTGSLGSGAVNVAENSYLKFARGGYAVVGAAITGAGFLEANGPGTVALTANNDAFTGIVNVNGGTLQLGDGGATGSLGTLSVNVGAGATFAVKRSGIPTISNTLNGEGSLAIVSSDVIVNSYNNHGGGVSVTGGGNLRVPMDAALGAYPWAPTPNAIRLDHGGLKNQDTDTLVDSYRGVTISGEAYFTAGWTKSLTISGPITGTGNIFINHDSGKVVFSNETSNWNGVLTLGASKPGFSGTTNGNLEIGTITNGGVAGPLGIASANPANLVFDGGRLIFNDFADTGANSTNRGFTLQGNGTIEVVTPLLTINGQATGTGNLTKAGPGTLVLTGNNDFAGEKIIAGGKLVATSTTALGGTGSFVRFTGTTGQLDLATDTSVAAYPITIGAGNAGTILANVATPGNGTTHALGGAELSTITLTVAAGGNVTGGDPRVSLASLGLAAGAAGTTTLNPTTANLTVGPVTIGPGGNHAKTLNLGGTSTTSHVIGSISDGLNVLSLSKTNDSVWTISGDNTFTGNVTVDDGVLAISHTNALGSTGKTVGVTGFAGQTPPQIPELQLMGGISPTISVLNTSGSGVGGLTGVLRNVSGDNTLTVTTHVNMTTGVGPTGMYSDSGTLTLNTPLVRAGATNRALILGGPGNGVINGVIANGTTVGLPVTKNGSGTWTLNGAHTYTGATTVNGGVLSLSQATLSDNAGVFIGASGKLNLNFTGIDRVKSLEINGQPKENGIYSAATDPDFITGSGSIRVGPGPGYTAWTSSYPFNSGVNDGENDDPDGDGISNLMEYVLGGVPIGTGANDTSILPVQTLNTNSIVFTFRRSDLSESDVTLKVQWSDSLGAWNDFATIGAADSPGVDVTEDSPNAEMDTVQVTIPRSLAPAGKLFVRLQATK